MVSLDEGSIGGSFRGSKSQGGFRHSNNTEFRKDFLLPFFVPGIVIPFTYQNSCNPMHLYRRHQKKQIKDLIQIYCEEASKLLRFGFGFGLPLIEGLGGNHILQLEQGRSGGHR